MSKHSSVNIKVAEDVIAHPCPSDLSLSVCSSQLPTAGISLPEGAVLCQCTQQAGSSPPHMTFTPRMKSFWSVCRRESTHKDSLNTLYVRKCAGVIPHNSRVTEEIVMDSTKWDWIIMNILYITGQVVSKLTVTATSSLITLFLLIFNRAMQASKACGAEQGPSYLNLGVVLGRKE